MRLIVSISFILAVSPLAGQTTVKPSLVAVRAESPIRLDGRFDEVSWRGAPIATGFIQRYPDPGREATLRTEVRVLYDDAAIYVAARMFDPHPDSIVAPLARRDPQDIYSDWIDIIFDSYHDRRTAFRFGVNPAGTKLDVYHFNDSDDDDSWDAIWDVATQIDSLGWTAELRIPLSQLRFHGAAGEQVWGMNMYRAVARRDEWTHWAPFLPSTPGFVSAFGTLHGLVGLQPPSPVELQPYVSSSLRTGGEASASPFRRSAKAATSIGADLRVGIGSALSLTATVNPDFGQVEVDPAVINLTSVETFFPEKRPFFLEGSGIFEFGSVPSNASFGFSRMVHWRRIGRAPQLSPNAEWADTPDPATIIGALKLSGQVGGGWSLGAVNATTAREDVAIVDAPGTRSRAGVEPLTNYFVGRMKRDFQSGRATLGLLTTATNRSLGGEFADALRSSAYLFGIDGTLASTNRRWTVGGSWMQSAVRGSTSSMAVTQRSSVRYFGRPDASYLSFDPLRQSLTGHDALVGVAYRGTPLFGSIQVRETTPGFESNDLGYLSRADVRSLAAAIGATHNSSQGWIRDASGTIYTVDGWNFGNTLYYQEHGANGSIQLPSFWTLGARVGMQPSVLDDRLTRGGPMVLFTRRWRASPFVQTDGRRAMIGRLGAAYLGLTNGGSNRSVTSTLTVRPRPSFQLIVSPSLEWLNDEAQYIRKVDDTLARRTYGRRYVFAGLHQRTFSTDIRAEWTFNARLSFQLFAQPFHSRGEFANYKELRAPRSLTFDVYGRDRGSVRAIGGHGVEIDPDGSGSASPFIVGGPSQASFLSTARRVNAVVRWEYASGSTLFLVWQQTHDDTRSVESDPAGSLSLPALNVVRLKISHRFGR